MAIYLLSVKALSRTQGRNVIAAAAYRAGEQLRDDNDFTSKKTKVHDYRRRRGVVASGIVLPADAPDNLSDRQTLWNAVERQEKRKDSRVAREVLIALPHELSAEERQAVTLKLVSHLVDTYGVGADYAIHAPDRHPKADKRNHHAHILITTRSIDANGLNPKVVAAFNDKKQGSQTIEAVREAWEGICNNALEAAQRPERISRHTLQVQGIERLPETKQGAIATMRERQGKDSFAAEERQAVKDYNATLEQIPEQDGHTEPENATTPIRRKRELNKARSAMRVARKRGKSVSSLLHRKRLKLRQRLQRQRRRQGERHRLMTAWAKCSGSNGGNINTVHHSYEPPEP